MSGLDVFAVLILLVIVVTIVGVVALLGILPGRIAKKRGHPQAEAINVLSWVGLLLTAGVLWAVALVWAFTKPVPQAESATSDAIRDLEARVAALETAMGKATAEGGRS